MPPTARLSVLSAAALMSVSATAALARGDAAFRFTLRSQQSSVSTDLTAAAVLSGTLVGDYNEKTNPGGTRTIPGIFGPTSGNTPIPFSGAAGFTGADTSRPAGEFNLILDLDAGTAIVSALTMDLTNGRELGVTLGLTIEYDSFRTRQPTAVFPGGIPLPIPFGQVNLTSMTLTQTDLSGAGVLEAAGPDAYRVTIVAPVELTASIEAPGDPLAIGPIVLPLPLVFDVTLGSGSASATLSFEQTFEQEIPLKLELPADQPLDLPTILPPGETAHLLLNASLTSLGIDLSIGALLDAAGEPIVFSRADWNRNGVVNEVDFYAFLLDFTTNGVDFNGDGASNTQDYFDFLTVYFTAS